MLPQMPVQLAFSENADGIGQVECWVFSAYFLEFMGVIDDRTLVSGLKRSVWAFLVQKWQSLNVEKAAAVTFFFFPFKSLSQNNCHLFDGSIANGKCANFSQKFENKLNLGTPRSTRMASRSFEDYFAAGINLLRLNGAAQVWKSLFPH